MMRLRASIFAALLLAMAPLRAQVITFMPQWTAQAQFAGYYVALEKGFYSEEGLEVIVDHFGGNASGSVLQQLDKGNVDIITTQLVSALVADGNGEDLVNVLQTSQVNGLMCAARFPVENPSSLNGAKVGRWKAGFADVCDLFCHRNGIELEWIPYVQGINLFVSGAVDAILCYSYSEYLQLLLATGGIPEQNIMRFRDYGFDYPEDGLYVKAGNYKKHKDEIDKFVRASKKGWDYAREHFDEALDITMKYTREFNIITNRTIQRLMLEEVLRLQVNPVTGKADYAPVSRESFEKLYRLLKETGKVSRELKYEEVIR